MGRMGNKKKPKNMVFFEDELIKKDDAKNLLDVLTVKLATSGKHKLDSPENIVSSNESKKNKRRKVKLENDTIPVLENSMEHCKSTEVINDVNKIEKKIKKKSKKQNIAENDKLFFDSDPTKKSQIINEDTLKLKKEKKYVEPKEENETANENYESSGVSDDLIKSKKTKESIRSLKRKKHVQLLEEKKLKTDFKLQQGALNYLSLWKHAKSEWKFEKLKQIWLQQNLFVTNKIPKECWETAVEYFNGAKGAIRKVILSDALRIIQEEDKAEAKNEDEDYQIRLKRARDIIQNLQE